jgi:Raf kinase inhibitor-like YbhB/YbcL family protein
MYDIPPKFTGVTEGVPTTGATALGAKQGRNDFRRTGYGGPCPPRGKPHRYFFKLYALDIEPGLPVDATKSDLLRAMEGHILAEGQLMGRYQRK